MKKFTRRIAVVLGAIAVSAGLVGATAGTAHADGGTPTVSLYKDTSWGR